MFKKMAFAAISSGLPDDGDNVKCPICLEIYDQPIEISCGHSFCNGCIMGCLSRVSISQCPVCRTSFTTRQMTNNTRLTNLINSLSETCSKCKQMVMLSSFRKHKDSCTGTYDTKSRLTFKPVAAVSQPQASSTIPNRSTFKCPYCGTANLDREGLIDHVSEDHNLDTQQVVCPICVSMPWGNPNQKSGNFHQHLNLRHKFDYDTYVDYNDEEDDILQAVLEKSRKEV